MQSAMDENQIFKKFKKGDKQVYKDMFDQYFMALKGFSRRFVEDEAVCDDIVQDAFIGLYKKRSEIQSIKSIKSYLYSGVRNGCLNYLRNDKIKQLHHDRLKELSSPWYSENYIVEEVHAELYLAIKDLTQAQREVVVMSMNGLSNPEIAEELSVSINTIKTLKKRAYTELRAKLKGIHWLLLLLLS